MYIGKDKSLTQKRLGISLAQLSKSSHESYELKSQENRNNSKHSEP